MIVIFIKNLIFIRLLQFILFLLYKNNLSVLMVERDLFEYRRQIKHIAQNKNKNKNKNVYLVYNFQENYTYIHD